MSEDRRRLRPDGGDAHLVDFEPPGIAPGKRSALTPGSRSPGDPGKRAVTEGLRFDPVANLGVLARDAERAIDQLKAAVTSGQPEAGIGARSVLARTLPWLRQAAQDPRPRQELRRAFLDEVEAAATPLLAQVPASTMPAPPRRGGMFSSAEHVAATGVSGEARPLPHLATIQASFGRHDVTGVRAHTGAAARDATRQLGALAYATGGDVAFANNSPELHTVAHEAAHVIQQRDVVSFKGAGGDATFEAHADAVADAVVAGRSAEPLLDAFAGRAANGIVQRKDLTVKAIVEGPWSLLDDRLSGAGDAAGSKEKKPPTRAELRGMMEHYLRYNHRDVWRSISTHFHSVTLPTPHERLDWRDYDAFVTKLFDQLATYIDDFAPLIKLDDALYPADTEKTIGAILPATLAWSSDIGMAVAHALHIAIVASIKRLAPRYLEVADSKGVSGEDRVLYSELVTSAPMDRYVGVALCWGRAVTVQAPDPKAAKAAKGKQVGLKKVTLSYPGAKDKSLWNWVRADAPSDATAEDVAAMLFEDDRGDKTSSAAFLLAAAPPLFGVPKRLALTNPDLKQYAPASVNTQDDSVDKELVQLASTDSRADEAALHQQRTPGTKPSGAPAELGKVLEALRDCSEQLAFTRDELAKWNLGQHVAGAEAFLRRKEAEVPTLDQKHLADWAPVVDGQKDRLARIAGGIHAVINAAGKLGIKDPNSDQAAPLREILELFAVAAGTSHMAKTSEAKLLQAMQQQSVLTLRALQATERNMMSGVDQLEHGAASNANITSLGGQAGTLQERSLRLQTQLANGEQVDPDELDDVSMKSEEVALESRLLGTILSIADLNKSAREAGSGDAAIIASAFSGAFRDLPALTKHIYDELSPIWNNLVIHRKDFDKEERWQSSPARKKQQREYRRQNLAEGQGKFHKLAANRDLEHFFKTATELIKNQQFRTACVKVAAMIGISLVAGAVAGLAARVVGGILLEATGATAVSELGIAARAGIAITRIGVDTTISSAGTVAVQGGSFSDVWKENIITALATSAVFGSISRYAAEQAQLEGKIAMTWSKATKLGKLGMIGKEVGAITAHTLWGAAMGEVAGRIVTGQSQPPPETLRDWALQGVSVAVGRHVSHVVMTKSKLYAQLEHSAESSGRGMVVAAAKLEGLAKRVISSKQPDLALELLNEHDQLMRQELEAIDRAYAKTGDPTGELAAARERIEAAAKAVGSQGMLDTKFTLIGMEELVPGALWKGTKEQIQKAMKQAETDRQKPKILSHDEISKRWKLQVGDRTIEIQEIISNSEPTAQELESRGAHPVPNARFNGLATQSDPKARITPEQAVERAHDAVTILDGVTHEYLSIDHGGNIWVSVGAEHCLVDITVGDAMADVAVHTYSRGMKQARIKISEHARLDDVTRGVAHELAEIKGLMGDPTLKVTDGPALTKGSSGEKMHHHDFGRQAELQVLLYELDSQPTRRAEILEEIDKLVDHLGLDKRKIAADGRAKKMLGEKIVKGVDLGNAKKRLKVARSAVEIPKDRIKGKNWNFNILVALPGMPDHLIAQGHVQLDDAGRPLGGPDFSLDKRRTIDGSEYRIDIEGVSSLTDFALDEAIKAFTKDFGHPPDTLPGSLADDNKAIFQKEYATQVADGKTPDLAKQLAAAKTPYVIARGKKGYTKLDVDPSTDTVDIVLGHPPRVHKVPARIQITVRKS